MANIKTAYPDLFRGLILRRPQSFHPRNCRELQMFLCEVQRIQHGYVEPLLVMQLKTPEDFRYPSTREAADREIRTYMTNLSGRVSKPSRILYLTNSTHSCLSTACSTRHQRNGDSTHFLHKGPRRGYRPSGTSRRWYHEDDMKTGCKSLLLLIASAWSQSHMWVCDLQWNRKRYEIQRSSKDCVINYLWKHPKRFAYVSDLDNLFSSAGHRKHNS